MSHNSAQSAADKQLNDEIAQQNAERQDKLNQMQQERMQIIQEGKGAVWNSIQE